jgi:arylsulfatase A-like enzyme
MRKNFFVKIVSAVLLFCGVAAGAEERPNFLWITCEDISPYLGCYGDELAQTPNLDRFAEGGVRFTRAYANAPVCGVARSVLLTGMHAPAVGAHQFRSRPLMPDAVGAYPKLLREAGYYCTNNAKKDYNSTLENDSTLWDDSSNKAHWRNRPAGKPFFAVFNIEHSHEGQIADKRWVNHIRNGLVPEIPRVDPADIKLPSYQPDLPEVRADWCRLIDQITMMDTMFARRLDELKKDGLLENTIVVFNSDHGGHLARAKRYIYNTGTQVPFIVYVPEKWAHMAPGKPGSVYDEIAEFVDVPKTFLSLAGAEVPEIMQGRILFGPDKEPAHQTAHFYRDRMNERPDFSRAVTDSRYYYIRNFRPHRPRGRDGRFGNNEQHNWNAWEKWYDSNPEAAGSLPAAQFYKPKPLTELHDLQSDPWQVDNLSGRPGFREIQARLEADLDQWMIENRDAGLMPESLVYDLIGPEKKYQTIYDYTHSDEYPVEQLLNVAKSASSGAPDQLASYLDMMKNNNPIIRNWGAYGIFLVRHSEPGVRQALEYMMEADAFPGNRIMAAQALGLCGNSTQAFAALMKEIGNANQSYVFYAAVNAFQYSHVDTLMTKQDWQKVRSRCGKQAGDHGDTMGYMWARRVIDDALTLWPERRKVD